MIESNDSWMNQLQEGRNDRSPIKEVGSYMSVHTLSLNTREKERDLTFLGNLDTFVSLIFLTTFRSKNKLEAFINFVEESLGLWNAKIYLNRNLFGISKSL